MLLFAPLSRYFRSKNDENDAQPSAENTLEDKDIDANTGKDSYSDKEESEEKNS